MTIEAWVLPTATNNAWRTVLAKELGDDLAYAMQANSTSGRPYSLVNTTGEQLAQGPAPLPANTWSHMTATYDGSALRLYVNGTLVDDHPGDRLNRDQQPGPLHLGGNSGLGEWFQGTLDDVRVYNRALSQPRSRRT